MNTMIEEERDYTQSDVTLAYNYEIQRIQDEYYKKKLIESLIGPFLSCVFHIILLVTLALVLVDKTKEPVSEISVTLEDIQNIELEPPPVIEEPIPEKIENTDLKNPVLTTIKVEDVKTEDKALEDTSDDAPSTDDNMANETVSEVVVTPSAFASPAISGGRSAAGRASSVSKFGGSKVGQEKLLKALWWLAKVQNPDGSWGEVPSYKAAMTGLALLTFLAHGETQTSKHFGKNVKKATMWLVNDPVNKDMANGYPHAIKTYALSEAFSMTGVSFLEEAMNKGVRIIIDGQQDGGCYDYRYSKDESRQDLSFAGWNFQALKAAKIAGCEEKGLDEAIYKAIAWLKKMGGEGIYSYPGKNNTPGGRLPAGTHTMRAVGVLCLQLLGEGKSKEIKDDIDFIAANDLLKLDWNKAPLESLYGWYYATQAMFQAGGANWRPWNRRFQKEVGDNQNPEGYWVYPGKSHGPDPNSLTGKIYATTLCSLMLTVYYRYLPTTKGAVGNREGEKNKMIKDVKQNIEEESLDLIE